VTQRSAKGIIDVEGIIEALCREPALPESALMNNVLQFANSSDPKFRRDGGNLAWTAVPESTLDAFRSFSGTVEMVQLPAAFYDEERTALRVALTDIIKARKKGVPPVHVVLWHELRSRVADIYDKNGGQHFLVLDNLPRAGDSLAGFAHYAPTPQIARLLLLFVHPERPYGRDLCQCQLASCGQFFFAIRDKPGMPRMKYCTKEHMDMGQEPVSERARRSRKNKREREEARNRRPKRRI
jgi:hypothetical protein